MKQSEDLRQLLNKIEHRGYPAYKETKGAWDFGKYILNIEHVQGDPFAAPSSLSVEIPGRTARFPEGLYNIKCRRIALQDFLIREFYKQCSRYSFKAKGSGKSGLIGVTRCGQEILERSACSLIPDNGKVILRFEVGFPANGRTINAKELIKIFFDFLPQCVEKALIYKNLDAKKIDEFVELAEDYQYISDHLEEEGLVAFVANGSLLPRESGVSEKPMKEGIIFKSPESMEVSFDLPGAGKKRGMGIKKGVTLIVGGGYHGKSTLLKALEGGVYPHIPGDGREYVVTARDAMKIRAEDGRCSHKGDISLFINDLPNGKDTTAFDTEDASGSTSQAANVVEAMEAGTSLFLIDEDTSATNFMVRDELMQRVICREMEPITPFIERVQGLYNDLGLSTILVAGSSGAYFHVADRVLQMDRYEPVDITKKAKETAASEVPVQSLDSKILKAKDCRKIFPNRDLKDKGRIKTKTLGKDGIMIGRETIDLRYVEQLLDEEQLTMLAQILKYLEDSVFDGKKTMTEIVEKLYEEIEKKSFVSVTGKQVPGSLAMPRKQEIYACLNRYRKMKVTL